MAGLTAPPRLGTANTERHVGGSSPGAGATETPTGYPRAGPHSAGPEGPQETARGGAGRAAQAPPPDTPPPAAPTLASRVASGPPLPGRGPAPLRHIRWARRRGGFQSGSPCAVSEVRRGGFHPSSPTGTRLLVRVTGPRTHPSLPRGAPPPPEARGSPLGRLLEPFPARCPFPRGCRFSPFCPLAPPAAPGHRAGPALELRRPRPPSRSPPPGPCPRAGTGDAALGLLCCARRRACGVRPRPAPREGRRPLCSALCVSPGVEVGVGEKRAPPRPRGGEVRAPRGKPGGGSGGCGAVGASRGLGSVSGQGIAPAASRKQPSCVSLSLPRSKFSVSRAAWPSGCVTTNREVTGRLWVGFWVRARAGDAGSIPSRGRAGGSGSLMLSSWMFLPPALPFSL